MSVDIESLLHGLGLERYAGSFRDNEIDAEVLPKLTDNHLKELGLPLGPRLKLLDAISKLIHDVVPLAVAPVSLETVLPATEADRRQLTVMFVDLVGSTALSTRLDPEEMGEVLRAYHDAVAAQIVRFGGYVAKYMGDGVLAYFGWPVAHEHSAECAVRAGLAVAATVPGLVAEPLSARIGIATGQVVVGNLVGSDEAKERSVVGETPNLAARLQAFAEPGGVVISDATRRLVGDLFAYRDLGPVRLNGFAEPIAASQVIGEGTAEDRFEAMHSSGFTALVGREHELALLLDRWERAKDGEGQVVLLSGEAGIGKSRLVRAMRERLALEPHTSREQFCSPYHTNSALHPLIGLIERAAAFSREDLPELKLQKLEALLEYATADISEVAPLLADLLAIPTHGRYPATEESPQQKKERTFQVLLDQLAGTAARGPALVLYEDAHWADPTTLELLGRVVERVRGLPVLVLVTSRPGFVPPWTGHGHIVALSLGRLGRREGAAMVERVSGGKALPAEVLDQILARTDGVPLFVEELTKAVIESGLLVDRGDRYELDGPVPPLAIPATLHDSLMTRLDRLAPTKEVAQLAACIGREFSHELIAAASDLLAPELNRALAELISAELVFPSGTSRDVSYVFKHALVQDAAHQSLLKSRRQQLHARIAAVLEEQFPDVAETQPDILARHCAEAGLVEKSAQYLHRAAQQAIARWAMAEAITQLQQGLELLAKLPDDVATRRQELDLQVTLGIPLMAIRGMGAPEVEQAYARARQLCSEVGDAPQLFSVIFGLRWYYEFKADLKSALELAEQLLDIAGRDNDSTRVMQAHCALATTLFWSGDFSSAQPHFEQAIALYDPSKHRALAVKFGSDPGVLAKGFASHNLWFLGFPEQALRTMDEALSLAQEADHPFSVAFALDHGTWLSQYSRDIAKTRHGAEADINFASQQGLPFFLAHGTMLRGWALTVGGEDAAGIADMEEGLAIHEKTGVLATRPYWLSLLAWAKGSGGDTGLGLELLDEASKFVFDQHLWNAEIDRQRGELLLLEDAPRVAKDKRYDATAEACFVRAIELSRRQGGKSLELRAAVSLARLWSVQNKRSEAHKLLSNVYGLFTEGFDTPDLLEAKVLLDSFG